MDCKEIDNLIFGRIKPHIYAFRTNTVPDYLKVGDTYRPVSVRLAEWKAYYNDLSKEFESEASVSDDVYFRDYSIHQFLENDKKKHRLTQKDLESISKENGSYYSNEFFKDTDKVDVKEAIEDINKDFKENSGKYQFYNSNDKTSTEFTYKRSTEKWILRPNQQETVENFEKARKAGRTNLLMYAVMRFGKSFTSLCCAEKMKAKFVLVVSAKADVKNEWKQNVEIPENFVGYEFLDSDSLKNTGILKEKLHDKKIKSIVLFLTLQDLQGKDLKEKHKEVFENKIDLLIVDETHFGARAESYGQVLRNAESVQKENSNLKKVEKNDDCIETEEADKQLKDLLSDKKLKVDIKLHLSGTPYRILMGSEFQKEDIICFCQFSDIVNEQEKWDKENIIQEKNKKEINEWDNPYYGFPQMIRFAFNPNESSLKKMNELKNNGFTTSFSALFYPKSIEKDDDEYYKKFVHEKEVLDLLEIIDGSKKDENILGFLDYDKIKNGKMCHHMVMVLPYCASCDAMQELIKDNKSKFKNLNTYEIINISGVESISEYKDTKSVKSKINKCEEEDKKTLTLTVNKMLTGATVKQWDTMIYLKDTSSPQEYDQAIFRLQNQYIKIYKDADGNTIKFNMKPQTLLVDFDPSRMFRMQEKKSLVYNVNTDKGGNLKLEERITEELHISPIVTANKDKIIQVVPNDILNAVREYSATRGIAEETNDIPVDINLKFNSEIFDEINRQNEIDSKSGFTVKAFQGEGDELDVDDSDSDETKISSKDRVQNENAQPDETEDVDSFVKKFKTYYARILFFSYLTEDNVISLEEIIKVSKSEENKRILKNLSLSTKILNLIQINMDKWGLSQLDYKIQNINDLAKDKNVEPLQGAMTALKKFGRLSESEVITPQNVCDDMISLLPKQSLIDAVTKNKCILDINSKTAEFAIALYKRYTEELGYNKESFMNNIYSIPSSKITYEFTRKIYKILGLSLDCIAENFVSYDLLNVKVKDKKGNETKEIDYERIKNILSQKKKFSEMKLSDEATGDNGMTFEAIVGNPPYQIMDGGAQASARPIYNEFFHIAADAKPTFISIIMPSRWYSGGKGLDDFRNKMLNDIHIEELHDFLNPETLFPNTNIRGGLCYFLWNKNYDNTEDLTRVATHSDKEIIGDVKRLMKTDGAEIFIRSSESISIINKVFVDKAESFEKYVSSRKPFGLDTTFAKSLNFKTSDKGMEIPIKCYGKGWKQGFVEKKLIKQHQEWIDMWKIFTSRANNIGTELNDDNLVTVIGKPNTVCTESYLILGIGLFLDEKSIENLKKYCTTKFFRFMHSIAKASQDATSKTYQFVPLQDFTEKSDIDWSVSIPEIDAQLYKKYALSKEEIAFIEKMIKPME